MGGDKAAFKTIVKRYQTQVAATVFGMLGQCPEAEDVGQEVFIRFYKALNTFRHESNIGTYLTRIAINLSLNHIKKERRKKPTHDEQPPDELPGSYNTEDELLMKHIRKAIMQLSPNYRSAIILRLVHGYSTQEAAEILNVPSGTLMSWLSRAQKLLQNEIDEGGEAL